MSPWSLFWHCQPYIAEYKTWLTSCSDLQFLLLFSFLMMSGTRTQKKWPMKLQRKVIVNNFCRGHQYERPEGQESRQFSVIKMNFEEPPTRGGAQGWIWNSNKTARHGFHFWPINRGKCGEVQPKWVLFFQYYIFFKIILFSMKMNFQKLLEGGGAHGWIRNIPELARLRFHFRLRNLGKVGEHSAMVSIMQEIHVLFIKW